MCCCCLVQQAEDLEDAVTLGHMYRIVKAAIMLNDAAVLEEMLKEVRECHCSVAGLRTVK